ncbi:MAG: hypothetical protein NC412_14855 [Roseburia sp.]|nr:hypothetical protein [Roseburia sp.]MCM1280022.1 hypothetical protein [Robinsoniella sp.]
MYGMADSVLCVRKRGIWKEKEIYFTIASTIFLIYSIVGYGMNFEQNIKKFNYASIVLIIAILCFAVSLAINIRVNKRKNQLLVSGEVIYAKIDRKNSWIMPDEAKIKCSYIKDGVLWIFEDRYIETGVGLNTSDNFYDTDVMPVIVNPKNYREYIVLFGDVLLSSRKGVNKPLYFTKIIRKINLNDKLETVETDISPIA